MADSLVLKFFGYIKNGGWRVDKHPRMMADIKGDGTFTAPKLVLNAYGYDKGGWRVDKHPRMMADINGDGKADIIGFGDNGVFTSLSKGDGTFTADSLVLKT